MERKPRNLAGSSTKPFGTDKKSSQDVSSKLWPRGGRRREPQAGSYAKSEQPRKPAPQRSKILVDKRPRPRGEQQQPNYGGKEATRLTGDYLYQDEPELGSVFIAGSKKQSLNHLLNFHYAPRELQQQQQQQRGGHKGHQHKLLTTGKHKYNKEHFIQANCQFIVNTSGDYKQYMNNPDALVDWTLIEQINIQVHELPTCPICLYPPAAAKMTRCGHIYCWSCMLHYLALSEKTWSKCPICHEAIHKKDLKSVVPIYHSSFGVNQSITFKLMKRARGSLVAYPFEQEITGFEEIFSVSDPQAKDVNTKLLLADRTYIKEIIDREKRHLEGQLAPDNPENCFIEEAMQLLLERETLVSSIEETVEKEDKVKSTEDDKVLDCGYEGAEQQPVKHFYFYQAQDGQHIYLHAINVRMLEHTYGTLKDAPKVLTGRIIEKEGGSMTEELRNRLRYLQHMPVTCQFEVAEISLNPSIICKDTIDFFKDQLESRRKKRQRRMRDEKKREKRIAEEENRQMGKFPAANIELESHLQFPEFGAEGVIAKERTVSESSNVSDRTCDTALSVAGSESSYSGPSFAKMLSKASTSAPARAHNAVPSIRLINVTGAQAPVPRRRTQSDSEPESEDYAPAPEFNRSFGDAIALALQQSTIADINPNTDNGKSGKKKKRNKQKILFATSMAYSGN